ncbi:hypothetical protein [Rubinisphaera sp. JC750]|uniref:hypothetical protein n=1 Tax=Rubinisphaera sp. JC750 TaxID=2898658 RepID=UPI001F46C10B|nr:hypothetical protein [Rubinisphaera sp. JC750]
MTEPDSTKLSPRLTGGTRLLLWLLPAAAILQIGVLAAGSIPLGVPGEWTWLRVPADSLGDLAWFPLVLTTLFYAGWLWLGEERVADAPRRVFCFWLLLLTLLGAVQLWTIRGLTPDIFGHSGQTWVTYYPRMSGYFTQVATTNESLSEFLDGYEEEVRQGDYLHQGTHPPGLPVGFLLGRQFLTANPQIAKSLDSFVPADVDLGISTLGELAAMKGGRVSPTERTLLWAHLLFTYLLAAATLLPLAALARALSLDRQTSWWIAGLWCVCPALTVFIPKSDVLFPFLSTSILAAYAWGCRVDGKAWQIALGLLAGSLFWLGMFCSLAFLALLPLLVLWSILHAWQTTAEEQLPLHERLRRAAPRLPWLTAGISLLAVVGWTGLCWGLYDLNLPAVWAINFSKHAEFYDHNARTYGLWLPANLIELAFSLGLPTFLLIVVGVIGLGRKPFTNRSQVLLLSVIITWGLLWVSGKNMGEAARLWLFLYPLMLPLAGTPFNGQPVGQARSIWLALLISQTVLAGAAAVLIDGFGFTAV